MLAAKHRHSTDADSSSDPSRPVSVNSSVYSADSGSLNSSPSGSKVTLPTREDVQSSLEHDLDIIDKLVADVAMQNSSLRISGDGLGRIQDEMTSSHSGSNDNLGVWDDLNTDDDSDEILEGECECVCGCVCV